MTRITTILLAAGIAAFPVSARAGSPPAAAAGPASAAAAPDSLGVPGLARPRTDLLLARGPAASPKAPLRIDLTHPGVHRLGLQPRVIELSSLDQVTVAADRGANFGLLVGYLGNLAGWWSEGTALALMGAGAAVGAAVEAGTGLDEPDYRLVWEP